MSREELMAMARECGHWNGVTVDMNDVGIEHFAALVSAKEREARQSAQIENELLKAKLAASGVALRRAVLAEREACASLVQSNADACDTYSTARIILEANAQAIRARGPLYDPRDVAFSKITPEARADGAQ